MSDTQTVNEVQPSGDSLATTTASVMAEEETKAEDHVDETPGACHKDRQSEITTNPPADTVQSAMPDSKRPFQVDRTRTGGETTDKKKEDEKLGIYKTLAIKLKKELVKTRDELQRLQAEYKTVVGDLKSKVEQLESDLASERVQNVNSNATLEATCKNLRSQLKTAENDLQSLQTEFDSYKTRATKIMQQNNFSLTNSNRALEEDRYKQLRSLNEEQKQQIKDLKSQICAITSKNSELEERVGQLNDQLNSAGRQAVYQRDLEIRLDSLMKENESLQQVVKQMKERHQVNKLVPNEQSDADKASKQPSNKQTADEPTQERHNNKLIETEGTATEEEGAIQISPPASVKDDAQTNSSSSFDSSTYGYVHIKPTAFEIISRTSVLEDAQNQIDNLTKAYLDSENTNSLLTEQVRALKEEIRRIQRGNDRIELANNLEYLKNVIFKFLSLDANQVEQKQRLVPVLSTILKLSPDETQKLNSLMLTERGGMASSFFKL